MHTSYEQERIPLIFGTYGIPKSVRDTREPYQKRLAVYTILTSIFLERIAFYTLAANLAINLETNKLNWTPTNGLIASSIFSGTSYISSIIFAVISDAKLGRAKTILVGFLLYLIGYILIILVITGSISECMHDGFNQSSDLYMITIIHERCADWILPSLIIIAIGSGAVQSNMAVFGAEQIQKSTITARYFDKYVVAVNMGAMFAMSATPFTVDDPIIYQTVYIVTASVLFAAALLFIIGWRYYIHVISDETVITKCIPVAINAVQSWRQYKKKINSIYKKQANSSESNLLSASHSLAEEEESIRIDERPTTFLDFAKVPNGQFHDRIVNEVKSLRSAFIVFTLLIPYWLIYTQINSTFRLQSQQAPESDDKISAIIVSVIDPITITVGALVLNLFIYKCMDARNSPLTIETKFVIGMCFAVISMCLAGTVETYRQHGYGNHSSKIPIFTQLPQNIAMGLSELFAIIASFEFAYFTAPRSAQTLFMSLRFFSVGVASYIDAAYIIIFPPPSYQSDSDQPVPHEKNPNLYIYYFTLAGLQLLFIMIFLVCQKKFRIIRMNPQQLERNYFPEHSSTSSSGRR